MDDTSKVLYRLALGLLTYLVIYYLVDKSILTVALAECIVICAVALFWAVFAIKIFIRFMKSK